MTHTTYTVYLASASSLTTYFSLANHSLVLFRKHLLQYLIGNLAKVPPGCSFSRHRRSMPHVSQGRPCLTEAGEALICLVSATDLAFLLELPGLLHLEVNFVMNSSLNQCIRANCTVIHVRKAALFASCCVGESLLYIVRSCKVFLRYIVLVLLW